MPTLVSVARRLGVAALIGAAALAAAPQARAAAALDTLQLAPGFRIALWSDQVPDARALALGARGTVFVGSRQAGKVYAVEPAEDGRRGGRVHVLASGLEQPVGVAFHDGDLYVSAIDRIVVLRDVERDLAKPPKPELVSDAFPKDKHHGWKFIAFGPDGKLYVPIGAPCNICDRGEGYAKIVRMNADGSGREDVAFGVRNSVGLAWHPTTGKLWFTDNGRDMLGDDVPGDEINRVDRIGAHYGYPYCHQGDLPDPEFGAGKACQDFVAPVRVFGAHVAALGLRFYTGSQFPAAYRNALIVAEHGSWNRSKKSGYRVMVARLDGDRIAAYEPLVDGFQKNEQAQGRPVDVQVMPDGSLLVSDDLAGALYRISYGD
ncbi:MAG: sorbosone dehydrogenase [Rhodanobacter denitrificans]|uniref:Sorbosone dehydrogenase n=1 Tax=Rhodanobacter denitrificans TaxID=666685 RepID=A0A2W5KDM5_9GAMM|nr:MAG: sorbosone dehydrogenase [Rhodanobacter denitrificans]